MSIELENLKHSLEDIKNLIQAEQTIQVRASDIFVKSLERAVGLEELAAKVKEAIDALRNDTA